MYSAYLGIKAMFSDNVTSMVKNISPFLMMNADVFYDASVVASLLQDKRSDLIVVDIGRYLEESMKVTEEHGRITAISKQIKPEKKLLAVLLMSIS